jgi:hypothetical protein
MGQRQSPDETQNPRPGRTSSTTGCAGSSAPASSNCTTASAWPPSSCRGAEGHRPIARCRRGSGGYPAFVTCSRGRRRPLSIRLTLARFATPTRFRAFAVIDPFRNLRLGGIRATEGARARGMQAGARRIGCFLAPTSYQPRPGRQSGRIIVPICSRLV